MLKLKFPRLSILMITIILSVILFYVGKTYSPFNTFLLSLGYVGLLLGGFFYAYGFTAAPATAVLLLLANEYNILLAGLLAGFGALVSDIVIFLLIRRSFKLELKKLGREKTFQYLKSREKRLFGSLRKYVNLVFAGFLIASPLPTEIGVTLLSSMRGLSLKKFIVLAYLLHTAGILIILWIGRAI